MTDMEEVQRREDVEEVAGEQPSSNVTADPVDGGANESNDKEEVHPDEDMGELHRREKVAVEQQQLPLDITADQIDDVANEEAKLKSLEPFSGDKLGGGINIVENVAAIDRKTVEVFELETTSVSTASVMVMEEEQVFTVVETTENARSIDEQGKISRVVEEREERKSGSSVKVIEFEYDGSQEEIELDLDKFYGHTPHCPNCSHRITKVILRRKLIVPEPSIYVKILGYCIKCVTIVRTTVSWHTIREVVRKMLIDSHEEKIEVEIPQGTDKDEEKDDGKDPTTTVITPTSHIFSKPAVEIPQGTDKDEEKDDGKYPTTTVIISTVEIPTDKDEEKDDGKYPTTTVIIPTETGEDIYLTIKLHEILKCVVYGGLIESITSLSVVASVAATDATTLNLFAIGLALLFSGLIAFCFNLVDLKNDVNSIKKYNELLGREKNDFLFHSTFAILSYVVFGLIAPTTYALAFRESDNKENKIIVAVVVAFACIFLLAIAKAHVRREKDKHPRYVETTRYYLIVAFSVSGVAYVVGYMIEMLMLKLGLFRSVQRVTCYVPQMISATPTWASSY